MTFLSYERKMLVGSGLKSKLSMFIRSVMSCYVTTLLLEECKDDSHTPETSKFDCRGQNTLHWSVFYIIGKLSKSRCRKWARMSHSDIFRTSYDKKKGRESNCQFDSRPLKVENRPDPDTCRWSATHRWKAFNENYKFSWDFIPIRGLSKEL